ncbi:MAG: nucleotidyl transferase AbiEii/AbiGii toxin family protein [Myxococcota bacterium]
MTGKKNMAASVRQRLLNKSKADKENFNLVLLRYGMERLLYRIGVSSYSDDFILKGAALFFLWEPDLRHRPTKDIDLLSSGSPDLDRLKEVFVDLCATPVHDDGLIFGPKTITVSRIKEDMEYEGVRVKLKATLGKIPIVLSVDVGFGDVVTPGPESASYPTLLEDSPAPSVQAYPRATVVAEKFQAMVDLGMANTRLKGRSELVSLINVLVRGWTKTSSVARLVRLAWYAVP